MARITAYSETGSTQGTTALADDDVLILDGSSGSKKITAKEFANAMCDKLSKNSASVGVGYGKSGLYRGANLGSGATFEAASTAAQRAAIADGTFTGLFIGDYWTVNNRIYRIADFNYWKRIGNTDFNVNHVVLVPDASFGGGKMNSTNITTGAYIGSEMNTDSSSVLNQARTAISSAFGGYLCTIRKYLPTTVRDGVETGNAYTSSTVDLMSEIEVYGSRIKSSKSKASATEKSQLALFRLNPAMVNFRSDYWLRDVVSDSYFANVHDRGSSDDNYASTSHGVRPVFAIQGAAS